MTARTHDVIAFASLVTVATYFPPQSLNLTTLGAAIVGNVVGSLIPDMDQASNRLWDLLPAGDHLGRIFRRLFLKHRTLSHSLLGAFLIYKMLEFLVPRVLNPAHVDGELVLVAMMIGYISHLVADSFTKDGLPLFFPLRTNIGFPPVKFFRITTGSFVEKFVVFPFALFYIFWFIGNNNREVLAIFSVLSVSP